MCVCIYLYLYVISASTSIHRDIMEDMLSPGSRDPQTGVYSQIPCFGILNGNGVFLSSTSNVPCECRTFSNLNGQ